ncbi:hypothetical protein BsWGS_02876 [Bradybaena similaris]
MKRSADQQQPSTSGVGAQLQKRGRLTVEQARLALECDLDLDVSDEEDLDEDSDYPGSDLETESEDDSEGVDIDTNLDGRGHRGGGDNIGVNFQAGWNRTFTAVDSTFDESVCGPQNMPDLIGMDSSPLDFLSLFLDDAFWTNLVTETNRRAAQVKENSPKSYYAKNFKPVSVEEIKAFIGLRLQMEYSVIKTRYNEYWKNESKNFISFTGGFREVISRDRFLSIWTFLHVVNEQDQTLNKADPIYKMRPFLDELMRKCVHFYKPKQYLSLDEGNCWGIPHNCSEKGI